MAGILYKRMKLNQILSIILFICAIVSKQANSQDNIGNKVTTYSRGFIFPLVTILLTFANFFMWKRGWKTPYSPHAIIGGPNRIFIRFARTRKRTMVLLALWVTFRAVYARSRSFTDFCKPPSTTADVTHSFNFSRLSCHRKTTCYIMLP